MADEVLVEVDDRGVATVTLNRPEVNNAYNDAMLRGVHAAIDAALDSRHTDHPVRCVVVRATSRPAPTCAGSPRCRRARPRRIRRPPS